MSCSAHDSAGNSSSASFTVHVIFDVFGHGSFSIPLNENRATNGVKAGAAVPIKFSLGGNFGNPLTTGYPRSHQIACDGEPVTPLDTSTLAAGNSGLQYDATADEYGYNWKTDESWASTCRQLDIRFIDGNTYSFEFVFR